MCFIYWGMKSAIYNINKASIFGLTVQYQECQVKKIQREFSPIIDFQ